MQNALKRVQHEAVMVNLQVLSQHCVKTLMYKDHINLNALRFYLKALNYVKTLL